MDPRSVVEQDGPTSTAAPAPARIAPPSPGTGTLGKTKRPSGIPAKTR